MDAMGSLLCVARGWRRRSRSLGAGSWRKLRSGRLRATLRPPIRRAFSFARRSDGQDRRRPRRVRRRPREHRAPRRRHADARRARHRRAEGARRRRRRPSRARRSSRSTRSATSRSCGPADGLDALVPLFDTADPGIRERVRRLVADLGARRGAGDRGGRADGAAHLARRVPSRCWARSARARPCARWSSCWRAATPSSRASPSRRCTRRRATRRQGPRAAPRARAGRRRASDGRGEPGREARDHPHPRQPRPARARAPGCSREATRDDAPETRAEALRALAACLRNEKLQAKEVSKVTAMLADPDFPRVVRPALDLLETPSLREGRAGVPARPPREPARRRALVRARQARRERSAARGERAALEPRRLRGRAALGRRLAQQDPRGAPGADEALHRRDRREHRLHDGRDARRLRPAVAAPDARRRSGSAI